MAYFAHLYGNIYSSNPSIDKDYAKINMDSVLFRTRFSNIYNHQFTPHLIYANTDSTQIDSLTLFDDGLHGDSLSNDGIYGGYIPPRQTEDFFSLGVSTIDNQTINILTHRIFADLQLQVLLHWIVFHAEKDRLNYYVKPFVHNGTIQQLQMQL